MNAKYPCSDCIIRACCSKFCPPTIDYFSRLIRAYSKCRNNSILMKHAANQVPFQTLSKIKSSYNHLFDIVIWNDSRSSYCAFSKQGTLITTGYIDL